MGRAFRNQRTISQILVMIIGIVLVTGILYVPEARASVTETITTNDIGSSFNVNWSLSPGTYSGMGSLTAPLTSTGSFTIESFTSTQLDLAGTIDNTTVLKNGLTQAYLMSVGFSTNPTVTPTLLTPGSVFNQVDSPGNFPGGYKNIDVCVFSANNCSGGAITSGLAAGSSDSFLLALTGNFGTSNPTLTLSDFAVKFQTNEGSFEFGGGGLTETPEPESILLFASALLLGLWGRFRSRLSLVFGGTRRV